MGFIPGPKGPGWIKCRPLGPENNEPTDDHSDCSSALSHLRMWVGFLRPTIQAPKVLGVRARPSTPATLKLSGDKPLGMMCRY